MKEVFCKKRCSEKIHKIHSFEIIHLVRWESFLWYAHVRVGKDAVSLTRRKLTYMKIKTLLREMKQVIQLILLGPMKYELLEF